MPVVASCFAVLGGAAPSHRRSEVRTTLRNTYSPWEELALLPHIELRREHIGFGRVGEYNHHQSLIRLEPAMPRRQARAVLCHELRHAEFGDVGSPDGGVTAWQEARADSAAARLLIDIYDLADVLLVHDENLVAAASTLRVSVTCLQVRIKRLHPAERHLLTRHLSEPWD